MMKKSILALMVVVWVCWMGTSPVLAEYFSFNVPDKTEGIVQEVRYPFWAESTYNAIWSTHLSGNGSSAYFYGGIPEADPENPVAHPASIIWTFWPVNKPVVAGDTVQCVWTNSQMYSPLTIGEGASGKASGQWPNIKLKTWYKFVTRIWKAPDNEPNATYIGQWFYDPDTQIWQHLATMRAPFSDGTLSGEGGFIEDFSHGNRKPRRTEWRNCYYLKDSNWKPANELTGITRQKNEKGDIGLIEDGTAAFFETCSGEDYKGTFGPGDAKVTVTLKQPDQPSLPNIAVDNITAIRQGNQLLVSWKIPPTGSPQLGYRIIVSDQDLNKLQVIERNDPEAREQLIDLKPDIKPTCIQLVIRDIFGSENIESKAKITPAELMAGAGVQKTSPGLDYVLVQSDKNEYWGEDGKSNWSALPDFDQSAHLLSGVVNGLDLTVHRRRVGYATKYKGFIRVPSDGIYRFWLLSNDGSRLTIDDKCVIDHNGVHSYSPLAGFATLGKGLHPIIVEYFKDTVRGEHGEFGDRLQLEWEGPGIARSIVPVNVYARNIAEKTPQITLVSPTEGSKSTNAAVRILAKVDMNGETPSRVDYYVDDTLWYSVDAQTKSNPAPQLLWTGKSTLRARLFYGTGKTVDSVPVNVDLSQATLGAWKFTAIGSRQRKAGAGSAASEISIVGDGLNDAWQEVEGDATIVAQVTDRADANRNMQEDDTHPADDWIGGVIFRGNLNANGGNPLGDRFCALFTSVDQTTHMQCNKDETPGGPTEGADLGKTNWLKLVRKGDTFTAYISEDGKKWIEKGTRELKLDKKLYLGVFIHTPHTYNPNLPRWTFEQIKITRP